MCGIAGFVNRDGAPAERAPLERMIAPIRYRGPDEGGLWTGGAVGLAHARLSIIDLSGGRQPMQIASGDYTITFNGEIFNYVELRKALLERGHKVVSDSDTEVILHLYREKGEACVDELNGEFAFAIWDARRQRLFAARDRMGVRPLYYCTTPGAFLFASEAKAILAHPAAPRRLDAAGLDQVFTWWCTLPPRTLFEGIRELPPGHSLTVRGGAVSVKPYWVLKYSEKKQDENASAEELLELLTDATRIRLRADVPVGAYLSGGLDSSLVTALARRVSSAPLKTFSITFEDPEFDESAHQQEVARMLGTEHQAVRCTEDDIGRVFPEVVWHAEKPILRTAPAPLYLLSRLVRRSGHKVVLTGEGSDEILGGYDIFKEAKVRRFCAAQPGSRLRPHLLKRLYPYLPRLQSQPVAWLRAFFKTSGIENPFFSHLPRWEMTSSLKGFYSDALRSEIGKHNQYADLERQLPESYADWDGFSRAQYLEASMLLPGYILSSQGDRVAMAHAVEGRFPFLDHRVVEFANALPARLKMRVLEEKYLLRRCARGLVPRSVCERRKQPYRAPDARSFFGRSARHYTEALLAPARVRQYGLFEPAAVTRLLEKCRAGRAAGAKDNMALVGILSSQLFMAQYMDPARTPPTQGPAL